MKIYPISIVTASLYIKKEWLLVMAWELSFDRRTVHELSFYAYTVHPIVYYATRPRLDKSRVETPNRVI